MTDIQLVAYLLARQIGQQDGKSPQELIGEAKAFWNTDRPAKKPVKAPDRSDVERVYAVYPNKDIYNDDRPLKNGKKDFEKIEVLLRTRTADNIIAEIKEYVALRQNPKRPIYLQNFQTYLNSLDNTDRDVAGERSNEIWQ